MLYTVHTCTCTACKSVPLYIDMRILDSGALTNAYFEISNKVE